VSSPARRRPDPPRAMLGGASALEQAMAAGDRASELLPGAWRRRRPSGTPRQVARPARSLSQRPAHGSHVHTRATCPRSGHAGQSLGHRPPVRARTPPSASRPGGTARAAGSRDSCARAAYGFGGVSPGPGSSRPAVLRSTCLTGMRFWRAALRASPGSWGLVARVRAGQGAAFVARGRSAARRLGRQPTQLARLAVSPEWSCRRLSMARCRDCSKGQPNVRCRSSVTAAVLR
jgi:hypothetical protein